MTEEVLDATEQEATEETTELEAQAETEVETLDPADSSTEKEPDPEPAKEPNKVQARIDELTRKRREAERDRDYYRDLSMQEKTPETEPETVEIKTLEDFEYDEKAYQGYLFNMAEQRAVEVTKQTLKEANSQAEVDSRQRAFQTKEEKYAQEMKDYVDVTRDPSLPLTKDMVEIATMSDDGPALLYHLAKNRDIAAKIANLPPTLAALEMGKLEAKLSKPTKKTSDAPPPPAKIDAVAPVTTKAIDDMSQTEFNEYRRKIIANRG